jgi:SulP family sulfate permease
LFGADELFYLPNSLLFSMSSVISKLQSSFHKNKKYFRADVLAGITVALALVPEAIAFAFVAGVTPLLSLQTAAMIALIAAVFSGRPGMISSSTAAIAVVLAPLIAVHGLEYLFATVVLMGIIQLLLGIFRVGKFTRIIPYPVVLGFLNGLAIVIFLSQWAQFQVDGQWLPPIDFAIMFGFVLVTMAIIHWFPRVTKAIPSALVAIGAVTLIGYLLEVFGIYQLLTVADFAGMKIVGELPLFHIPMVELSLETLSIIAPYAIIASLVGLTEATLTLRVLDEMTNTRGKINKEFFAQGIANFANGFFGGMGGDAMVGQSIINTKSGGRTRLSGLVAGMGLLLFLLFAAPLVNAIALASLVGLMFMVVISTFKWESLKYRGKLPPADVFVIGLVTIVTVFADLATAVIAGVIISTVIFAWEKGKQLDFNVSTNKKGEKVYKVNGVLFFGSTQNFKDYFEPANDPDSVIIDLKYGKIMDSSAIEAINSVVERYEREGKSILITRAAENCRKLLLNAKGITKIDTSDEYDPTARW